MNKVNDIDVLHYILSNLGHGSDLYGNIDDNGKAFAETDSEAAAGSLSEILEALGYNERDDIYLNKDIVVHYSREDKIDEDGCWKAVFKEL